MSDDCACRGCPNKAEKAAFSPGMDAYCNDPCTVERHDIPRGFPFHPKNIILEVTHYTVQVYGHGQEYWFEGIFPTREEAMDHSRIMAKKYGCAIIIPIREAQKFET